MGCRMKVCLAIVLTRAWMDAFDDTNAKETTETKPVAVKYDVP